MTNKIISLFEFFDQSEIDCFYPIGDGVMGGISIGALIASEDNTATFRGSVSLENNGGFASIRAALEISDLSSGEGIVLRSKGDGKHYKLRLLNSSSFDTIVYESSFVSSMGCWEEIELPFVSFQPMWRGKIVENASAFDKKNVCSLGLMISEKQAGPFALCVDWIRIYQ